MPSYRRSYLGPGFVLAGGLAAAMGVAGPALAQSAPNNNVAAESLFEDARALAASGKFAEACPKFEESERLGPSVATLLNLGNCWEKVGRTASAWATYREAASAANAAGRKDYLATALRRADALAPKLARLTVSVAQPTPGLQVKRDGVAVDSAEWGAGIPVDTGPHTVDASAPAHKPWTVTVDVAQDGAQASVNVPALEEAPADATPAAPSDSTSPAPVSVTPLGTTPSPETVRPGAGNTQRVVGVVVGAVGIVSAGLGGLFAVSAKNQYNSSLVNCDPQNHNECNEAGVSKRDDARSAGTAATVLLGAGAAAIITGGVLWFAAPRARSSASADRSRSAAATFEIEPTFGGVIARGAW